MSWSDISELRNVLPLHRWRLYQTINSIMESIKFEDLGISDLIDDVSIYDSELLGIVHETYVFSVVKALADHGVRVDLEQSINLETLTSILSTILILPTISDIAAAALAIISDDDDSVMILANLVDLVTGSTPDWHQVQEQLADVDEALIFRITKSLEYVRTDIPVVLRTDIKTRYLTRVTRRDGIVWDWLTTGGRFGNSVESLLLRLGSQLEDLTIEELARECIGLVLASDTEGDALKEAYNGVGNILVEDLNRLTKFIALGEVALYE